MENLKIGVITDGKYGDRAFENIKKRFDSTWITVPEIPTNVILDDELELDIPLCDLYISYVRHPDVILQLAELQLPLILGVLPGFGLLDQAKDINSKIVHAPTMCSLENNTGIPEVDHFTSYYGKPIYEPRFDSNWRFEDIIVKRSSLCGSSEAGAEFLKNKEFNEANLQEFALCVCHECRAPRFGRTCDKEVAGIIHLNSLFSSMPDIPLSNLNTDLNKFIDNMKNEYIKRKENSKFD